jgi:hypothetical protein
MHTIIIIIIIIIIKTEKKKIRLSLFLYLAVKVPKLRNKKIIIYFSTLIPDTHTLSVLPFACHQNKLALKEKGEEERSFYFLSIKRKPLLIMNHFDLFSF